MFKKLLVFLIFSLGIFACTSAKTVEPLPERPYSIAETQTKRPPVFYPVRSVRSSSPGYTEFASNPSRKIIIKKFFYDLPDTSLCEVGQALATSLKYHFYCAPSLEERKYSVNKVLTAEELRVLIEQENNVKVMIDTINKDVRLLAAERIVPQFAK